METGSLISWVLLFFIYITNGQPVVVERWLIAHVLLRPRHLDMVNSEPELERVEI